MVVNSQYLQLRPGHTQNLNNTYSIKKKKNQRTIIIYLMELNEPSQFNFVEEMLLVIQ